MQCKCLALGSGAIRRKEVFACQKDNHTRFNCNPPRCLNPGGGPQEEELKRLLVDYFAEEMIERKWEERRLEEAGIKQEVVGGAELADGV